MVKVVSSTNSDNFYRPINGPRKADVSELIEETDGLWIYL